MASNMKDLIGAITEGLSPEEMCLAGLQGMIAGEISMKRQALGMTQGDLAEKLGVSQGLVSRWESADSNFTLETLVRIASALDLKMQSPFVPALPRSYSIGNSNVYPHPASGGSWHSVTSNLPSDYTALEN